MGPLISFDEIAEESSFFYDIDQPLDWQEVFGNSNPLSLEVGFGNGKFLIEIAALNPQINFFGIDFYHKGIRKLVTRINKLQIQNIRILYGDARERIPQIFETDQLDSIFINFPDPWPKKRHIKRRLIKPKFISMLTSKVTPDGHIHLATDSESYARRNDGIPERSNGIEKLLRIRKFPRKPRGFSSIQIRTKFYQCRGKNILHGVSKMRTKRARMKQLYTGDASGFR